MDDLISRQAAIDRATKEHDFFRGAATVSDKARRDELLNVMCWLGELPSAQRTGKWLDANICGELPVIVCDQCNTFYPLSFGEFHNFCPNCGADMRGKQDG